MEAAKTGRKIAALAALLALLFASASAVANPENRVRANFEPVPYSHLADAAQPLDPHRGYAAFVYDLAAESLAARIMESGAIPSNAVLDAAYIAVATVNQMDYLLTWNCKHLANAQIIRRVAVVCNQEGYDMPVICTPEELMGG